MSLFTNVEEIRKYLAVSSDSSIEDIQPSIDEAEAKIISKYIGQELYDYIHEQYISESSVSEEDQILFDRIRRPIANLAYFYYVPTMLVMISSGGARVTETDTQKAAQPWHINQLNASLRAAADNGIENLLIYLESKKDTYPQWRDSPVSKAAVDLTITTAAAFQTYFNINEQRRTFIALRPLIEKSENFDLQDCLGTENFNELKLGLKNRNLDSKWNPLMYDIRGCIANYTIARACVELKIHVGADGLSVIEFVNKDQSLKNKRSASSTDTDTLRFTAMQDGDRYLKRVRAYLEDHASQFNNYKPLDTSGANSYPVATNKQEYGTFIA